MHNNGFSSSFTYSVESWVGDTSAIYYIPPESGASGTIGLQLEVTTALGDSYFCRFEAGDGVVTETASMPNPDQLAVVVNGAFYVIEVNNPGSFECPTNSDVIKLVPVIDVELLIAITSVDMVAIGSEGVAWVSDRISLDGIEEVVISGSSIFATVINPATGRPDNVKLALSSGKVSWTGGPDSLLR